MSPEANLADLLFAADGPSDDLLVHAQGIDYLRGEVTALATDMARSLVDLGVGPGMPVAVLLPNDVAAVAALFGVWRVGAVFIPLNPRGAASERSQILERLQPAVVITLDEFVSSVRDRAVVVIDGLRVTAVPQPIRCEALDHGVALVQFTSGTTGEPKPVQLTHAGVLQLLDGVIATLRGKVDAGAPAKRPMPNLVPVSLSLWAGVYQVLFALRVGAAVIVMDQFDPAEFQRLVARFEIRSTVLPPAAMSSLTDDTTIADLAPLKYVRSITAPLSPLQARRFRDRFGIAVLNSYGQTEIGGEIVGWSAADSREFGDDKLGSVGRPHRDVQIRAVDEHGVTQDADGEGELWVLTPVVAAGYADGSDFGDRLSADGWFRTGDIGRVDRDGFVWIDGRVSDMINRGGLKVHPGEVEEVLRLDPAVVDVAVVGIDDERLGQVPWAFVVGVSSSDSGRLSSLCRLHLAPYKVPVRFVAIDDLPRNEVGKVVRRALVEGAQV